MSELEIMEYCDLQARLFGGGRYNFRNNKEKEDVEVRYIELSIIIQKDFLDSFPLRWGYAKFCPTCKGKKWVEGLISSYPCPQCGGTGIITTPTTL